MPADTKLHAEVLADLRGASWTRRLTLVGVALWLAYEWGPGNETVTPSLVFWALGRSDGLGNVVAAAAFAAVFTLLQQGASGMTALLGFSLFDRTSQAAWRRLSADGTRQPTRWHNLDLSARIGVVFTLGTTAVALVEVVGSGRVGPRAHTRAVLESAALCALVVGAVAGAAGTVAHVGREVDRLRVPAEWTVSVLANPLPWLALAVAPLVRRRLSS